MDTPDDRFALANLAVAIGVTVSVFVIGSLPVELTPYPGYGWMQVPGSRASSRWESLAPGGRTGTGP